MARESGRECFALGSGPFVELLDRPSAEKEQAETERAVETNTKGEGMQKAIIVSLVVLLCVGSIMAQERFDPPRGLAWGQNHDDVKEILKSKDLKLEKLKHEKDYPATLWFAKIKKMKLFDEKVDEAYAVFDTDTGLCAVLHYFSWDNQEQTTNMFETPNKGRSQCWEFFQKLRRGLIAKYGEPNKDETTSTYGESIASGVQLAAEWLSPERDKIKLVISRRKVNAVIVRIDKYITGLVYATPEYVETMEGTLADTDEL